MNNKRDPLLSPEVWLLDFVWTWTGRFVGYWDKKDLWASNGKHIGRRHGLDIYAPNGRYIGERMSNNRLAVNKAKAGLVTTPFVPFPSRPTQAKQPDLDRLSLYTGFEDFWVAGEL